MLESGYYPAGAEFDPNAPWNECDPEEITRECDIWNSVRKTMPIATTDYVPVNPLDDDPDLSEVDWSDEFATRHYDIPELLEELSNLVRKYAPQGMTVSEQRHIRRVLSEAEGWETDELHVEEL